MPTTLGLFYLAAVSIMFVFWIYGVVSFCADLRYRYVPFVAERLRRLAVGR